MNLKAGITVSLYPNPGNDHCLLLRLVTKTTEEGRQVAAEKKDKPMISR